MIYTNEYDAPQPIVALRELHNRVAELESNELEMWACCFKANDPADKILRNISPVQVVVSIVEEEVRYRGRVHILKAYEQNGYASGRRKAIKIDSANSHGDLLLCDTYEECVRVYNLMVQKELEYTERILASRTAYLQNRISELRNSLIPGYISETAAPES